MAWMVLVVSALFEAVWATALDRIDGWSRPVPILVFLAGMTISMSGLAWSMRAIPVGTAYAVWVGVGAVATLAYSMASGNESVSPVKVALVLGIVGCVGGLKLVSGH